MCTYKKKIVSIHSVVNICVCVYTERESTAYLCRYRENDIVTNIYVCMGVMTFPHITSIRLQGANNFLFLLTAKHYNGIYS